ncbi:MAG: HAMP domain-containing histidine kinase, partial [Verrucomicrobia bacterium]|nr:HAMP domain-containing histidine kinase [Verrucomicrobiota bacterium]
GKAEADEAKASKDALPERRGWRPQVLDGRLHVLGWVRPAGTSEYRGLELEMAALVNRLRGALPAEVGFGEGYALRDGQGRVLHQSGAVPAGGAPLVKVALGEAWLPGWEVGGYFPGPAAGDGGSGFFWLGAVLVGIFVAAILAGGSLLWWEARRSEAEAAQKTSFVANVSHEFKTPLTTIRLYAELLELGRVRDAAQAGEYLRTIGRETQRLARLVNNALDFSRLEQGRKKYALETVEVRAVLAQLLDTLAPRAAEAGVLLRPRLPDAPTAIATDRDAFEQIVLNLLDNAFKYGAAGKEVGVDLTRRSDGGVEVHVCDRGPGVPAEHRTRIFEKFHRVDESLTAEKTGTGLGLSIARQLARGLGGDLRYQPREGGGAEFILVLP